MVISSMNITLQISHFRNFLVTAWPQLDCLMDSHDWDSDGNFIDDWLQVNWELLVERELLGLKGGSIKSLSIPEYRLTLRPPGPIYAVHAIPKNGVPILCGKTDNPINFDSGVRLFSLVSRKFGGFGIYPPFDLAYLVKDSTKEIFLAEFAALEFHLKEIH